MAIIYNYSLIKFRIRKTYLNAITMATLSLARARFGSHMAKPFIHAGRYRLEVIIARSKGSGS